MSREGKSWRRLRVLFVEDSRADFELSCKELRRDDLDVQADTTDRPETFRELISRNEYDLIITDYGLPGWTGLDTIRLLKEAGKQTPVILLTGSLGDQTAVECIKAGASDYVLKENLARLPHAVKLVLRDAETDRRRRQAEIKLEQYAAQLERSNQELQEFLRIASHDMQEPLRKVRLFIGRLQAQLGSTADAAVQHTMDRIEAGAGRMASILEALVSYSKTAVEVQPVVPVDLSEVVTMVLCELRQQIQAADAQVEVGPLPTLSANPEQIGLLFYHLVANALAFRSPDRRPRVHVDSRGREDGCVEVSVRDNGIGFEEQYAERIFQPFQQLSPGDGAAGTGIGLAICRKIALQHGGTIRATSRPGQGSTFTLTLPCGGVETATTGAAESSLAVR